MDFACPRCGEPTDPSRAEYGHDGHLLCRACIQARATLKAEAVDRSAGKRTPFIYAGAASASVLLGAVGWFMDAGPTLFLPVSGLIAMLLASWPLLALLRRAVVKRHLDWFPVAIVVASFAGILLGSATLIVGGLYFLVHEWRPLG